MKFPIIKQPSIHPLVKETIKNAKKYIENHKDDYNTQFMHFCPYCGAPLEQTNRMEKLETLCEHVSCIEPSLKSVYKCSAHCELSKTSKWNFDGEMYYDFPDDITKDEKEILWQQHFKNQKICFGAKINN